MTAPKAIIAATAADALAHATESYLNLGSDPLLDSINIRAIRMELSRQSFEVSGASVQVLGGFAR